MRFAPFIALTMCAITTGRLHAQLEFEHPMTGEAISLTAPLPSHWDAFNQFEHLWKTA